ncbi:recombinase family protein [Candidatus Tisiphia endosymbiont of Empis tessellata]|uniref:recombinase family protein n=1 Tax=Candidatus Tisiphia endosymbiont of Empis tessellata TaxID=3066259 RepID=UPI00313F0FF3
MHIKGHGTGHNKGKIIIDPNRGPLIKKIFETYATGSHTLPEILKKTKEWGLRNSRGNQDYLCHSYLYSIITNPFYYGVMRVLKTKKEYQHIYPPLISKELFDTCQRVRVNWNKKPFKYGEKEYIFRGLIKCAVTGRVVTAETKKKTYINGQTEEWIYLRTWDSNKPNRRIYVKEEIILQEVEKVLATLHLDPNLLAEVITYIKSSAKIEQGFHKMRIGELHTEHTKIKTRMDRLTDLFLDGDISKEDHEGKRQQLIQKREDIVREIENHDYADDKFSECLVNLVELASGALETFKGSTTEGKRKLMNLVFANLELKDGKLDFMLRPPFDAFVKCTKIEEWRTLEDSNL